MELSGIPLGDHREDEAPVDQHVIADLELRHQQSVHPHAPALELDLHARAILLEHHARKAHTHDTRSPSERLSCLANRSTDSATGGERNMPRSTLSASMP